jgi:RNA polymerase sigma-70 factor (ECF subfamily)
METAILFRKSKQTRDPAKPESGGLVGSVTDEGLVTAAGQGDVRAFERLYRLHHSRVYGLCLRMTRDRDMAEDCLQLTFIHAWRSLATFEGRSAFSSWLHRIAVNQVLSHKRSRKSWLEFDSDALLDDSSDEYNDAVAHGAPEGRTDLMDVERALSKLPEGARYVIVLQTVYGYSHEEVADMLGIAVGTCKAQLHRGRRLLRERLNLDA